jgi:hypothetical protein
VHQRSRLGVVGCLEDAAKGGSTEAKAGHLDNELGRDEEMR